MRSKVLGLAVTLLCLSPMAWAVSSDLAYLGVTELQERMEKGSLTAVDLVSFHLQRIAEIDRSGPKLGSVIEVNPDALAIAAALDQERSERGPRGSLHGIPVLLKANIDTGDRMATSAGSIALQAHRAPDDAFHVSALREAGVVILGKANLSEWANFRSSDSSSGWSSLGGQTRNPHSTDRNPCGSSSGSAVAVAAGLTVLAVGTETDGSIVCPSGVNGIVGIKPTVGLVSRDGIIPIAHTQDTAGPMARSVTDAAILLGVLAAHDPTDPAAEDHPGARDYTEGLGRDSLQGVRIGVRRDFYGEGEFPQVRFMLERVMEALRAMGATVVDPVELGIPDEARDAEYEVLLYEFKADLNRYLAEGGVDESVDTLAEVIQFNKQNADRVMPWFGQDVFEAAQAKGPLSDAAYNEALLASHVRVAEIIQAVMEEHQLDALIAPTNGPAWTTDWVNGDSFSVGSSSAAAVSGYPAVTIPMGDIHGLPIGVSILGRPYSEPELIGVAFALEQSLEARRTPSFQPSLEDPPP